MSDHMQILDDDLVAFIEANKATVIREGDPRLREVSEPVTEFGEELAELIKRMIATMVFNRGRGIAAVQIGVLQRVIIVTADRETITMVNPRIIRTLNRNTVEQEGCLSMPGYYRNVERPAKCEIEWYTPKGELKTRNCFGELARVFQHEYDHLEGILLSDKEPAR